MQPRFSPKGLLFHGSIKTVVFKAAAACVYSRAGIWIVWDVLRKFVFNPLIDFLYRQKISKFMKPERKNLSPMSRKTCNSARLTLTICLQWTGPKTVAGRHQRSFLTDLLSWMWLPRVCTMGSQVTKAWTLFKIETLRIYRHSGLRTTSSTSFSLPIISTCPFSTVINFSTVSSS